MKEERTYTQNNEKGKMSVSKKTQVKIDKVSRKQTWFILVLYLRTA